MTNKSRFIFTLGILIMIPVPWSPVVAQAEAPSKSDHIARHTFSDQSLIKAAHYLLYHPVGNPPPEKRSLLIYLYGAGGSVEDYNFKRAPYALLREQLAQRGYTVLVPDLGKYHFMNTQAKTILDGMVDQVLKHESIPANRVHVMGTSMGGGSSLAYALHRPDMIRSVCAVMPMTDFKDWAIENKGYVDLVANAYGGIYEKAPEVYDQNSAIKNVEVFKKIPVMLVHGDADSTVLYSQSTKLTDLLKSKGYAYTLCTAEGQGHKDEAMREFQSQAVDFFDTAVRRESK